MLPGGHDQPGGQQACPLPAPRTSQVRPPLLVECGFMCTVQREHFACIIVYRKVLFGGACVYDIRERDFDECV